MALKGTLKDFGIADIFQLVSQQKKTGTLTFSSRGHEVQVSFAEGNIVRANVANRSKKDLIGNRLVRAGLLTEGQLDQALERQKRTGEPLGQVLTKAGGLRDDMFRHVAWLQTTESIYQLFSWNSGNYAFEPGLVETDTDVEPIGADAILMEGFRQVDEWPNVNARIPSRRMTFQVQKPLNPPPDEKQSTRIPNDSEQRTYDLAAAGHDVQAVIDRSLLGEFEACRALSTLVQLGFLKGMLPERGRDDTDTLWKAPRTRLGISGAVAGLGLVLALGALSQLNLAAMGLSRPSAYATDDPALQRWISEAQLERLRTAVLAYRTEKGTLPERLPQLSEANLLPEQDVLYPWKEAYFYHRSSNIRFVLLPPFR